MLPHAIFTRRALAAAVLTGCVFGANADTAPGDVVIENISISEPLTEEAGDPVAGRQVFSDRKLGNCLACHVNADLSDQLFHGEVGPVMDGAGARWTPEQLRAIVVNSRAVFTDRTIMPAFYSLDVGENVAEDFVGKTILTAQQVEDVIAYLGTLN